MSATTATATATAAAPLAPLLALLDGCRHPAEAVQRLRQVLPRMRIQALDPADLADEKPVATSPAWQLFLAASDGHCWRMTDNTVEAAAVFVVPAGAAP
jgi:hypothetical protein